MLHKLPAGPKLLGMFGVGLASSIAIALPPAPGLAIGVVVFALGVACARVAGIRPATLRGALLPLGITLAAVGAAQWWSNGGLAAAGTLLRLVGLLLLGFALLASTRVSELLAALERALAPLRRWGVRPERTALAAAMAIRAIPLLAAAFQTARQARLARGGPAGLTALPGLIVATLVAAVRLADAMAEALIARGER